jgi:FlaA1/EpsC-like NDP-sugar epimerase
MTGQVLLSTAYLPPIQYISKFMLYERVLIEKHENYQKQSYRNRCYIYGANGKQCLVIPVVKNHGEKTPITQVEIDFTPSWQKIHLKSIESAYRLSPFYEYYADEFTNAFNAEIPLLFDWNMHLLNKILSFLNIKQEPDVTQSWSGTSEGEDFRQSISPKTRLEKPDPHFHVKPYQQVFIDRYNFIPNLSIIDLLFNEGPEASSILK